MVEICKLFQACIQLTNVALVLKNQELILKTHGCRTQDLPANQRFSKDAIAKAAKEFKILAIKRGEWISSNEIRTVIKHAPWNSAKTIIEKFEFSSYFKRGSTYYFNRKDLIELNKELKKRNINLDKYIELLNDKEKFQKYVNGIIMP